MSVDHIMSATAGDDWAYSKGHLRTRLLLLRSQLHAKTSLSFKTTNISRFLSRKAEKLAFWFEFNNTCLSQVESHTFQGVQIVSALILHLTQQIIRLSRDYADCPMRLSYRLALFISKLSYYLFTAIAPNSYY